MGTNRHAGDASRDLIIPASQIQGDLKFRPRGVGHKSGRGKMTVCRHWVLISEDERECGDCGKLEGVRPD